MQVSISSTSLAANVSVRAVPVEYENPRCLSLPARLQYSQDPDVGSSIRLTGCRVVGAGQRIVLPRSSSNFREPARALCGEGGQPASNALSLLIAADGERQLS